MKKLTAVFITLVVLLTCAGCSDSSLDQDGPKHITFINSMDVVVTSVTATVNGNVTDNLLTAETQLKKDGRSMLKIPASSGSELTNIELEVVDSKGTKYKFKDLDIKNAGSLTFKLNASGDPTIVISS